MLDCLIVGTGGAIGAVLRYLMGKIPIGSEGGFPIKTFAVNIIGCFVIGLAAALAVKQLADNPKAVLFLKVGICGGFTTFSSFALETSILIENESYGTAFVYITLSIILGIAAVFVAQLFVKSIWN